MITKMRWTPTGQVRRQPARDTDVAEAGRGARSSSDRVEGMVDRRPPPGKQRDFRNTTGKDTKARHHCSERGNYIDQPDSHYIVIRFHRLRPFVYDSWIILTAPRWFAIMHKQITLVRRSPLRESASSLLQYQATLEKANRCFRLARAVNDSDVTRSLEEMGEDYLRAAEYLRADLQDGVAMAST